MLLGDVPFYLDRILWVTELFILSRPTQNTHSVMTDEDKVRCISSSSARLSQEESALLETCQSRSHSSPPGLLPV